MQWTPDILAELPSSFYRVTAKALVFDDQNRLLVLINDDGGYELPGGGMEHGETFEQCLQREVSEELHAEVAAVGEIRCLYTTRSLFHDIPVVRIVAVVTLVHHDVVAGDTLVDHQWVTKDQFSALDWRYEGDLADCVNQIWGKTERS